LRGVGVVEVAVCIEGNMVLVGAVVVVVVIVMVVVVLWELLGIWCHFVFLEHKHDQMVCALPQVYKHL
jgi:hypothetical protein